MNVETMTDAERGRALSRLIRLERKMKKAHPAIKAKVSQQIDALTRKIASRFIEVAPNGWVVKSLIEFTATGGGE